MLKLDYNFFFNIIDILILYWLMKKYLFGPVMAIMEKRTNTIKDSLADAENTNQEAQQLKQEYENVLSTADDKASQIIKAAKERAGQEHEKQIRETSEEVARMIQEANKTIEFERQKSMQGIQSEIAKIAMIAAAKVIQKNVDDSTNNQLVNDFLKEAGTGK